MPHKDITFFENRIKKTKDLNERIRLSVLLARVNGHSIKTIASVLRISVSTVYEYLSDFDREKKIRNKSQTGRNPKLSESQETELEELVAKVSYKSLNALCLYVKEKYDVLYTTSGMRDWLKRKNLQKASKKKLFVKN